MSQAGVIDSLQFARDRGERRGLLNLDAMPRLADSGCIAATLNYALQGGESPEHRPSLHLEVQGQIVLECQRCLAPLETPVAVEVDLELAHNQAEIDAAEDDADRVLASKHMDIAALVEDEAILALPMIPTHEQCVEIAERSPAQKVSPFAVLAALKKK